MFSTLRILHRRMERFPCSVRVLRRIRSTISSNDTSTSADKPSDEEHSRTTIIQQTYQNKKYNCEFNWTIPNFEIYHNTKLDSRPFSPDNHNYEWMLKLGISQCDDGAHDVLLYLNAANNSAQKFGHTSGKVQAGLVNSRGEKICIRKDTFYTKTRDYSSIWRSAVHRMYLIKRDDLLEEINGSLLSQGALKIFCNLSFILLNDANSKQQCQNFEKYFNDRESSDLTINVDGKVYPGHKFVLAAHSPIFEAMFAHDAKENQHGVIDIEGVDEKVFAEMLRYMYTGYVENLQAIALDLAIAADKYNIEKLKSLCEWKIGESVTAETAVKSLISSELYNLQEAKEIITKYICENTKEVMKSGGLDDLRDHPKLLIDIIKGSSHSIHGGRYLFKDIN